MVIRSLIIVAALCMNTIVKAQHPPVFEGMETDTSYIVLGDLEMNLVKYGYGAVHPSFLTIHDDEDTGVKAAFKYIAENGGSIIDSQYGGTRNFKFIHQEVTYQTDPNSIYTKTGIRPGLEKFGRAHEDVITELENAGKIILNYYNPLKTGYIFTLHNNGDSGFGISSYLKGYDLETAADSLYINFQMDNDDMVLVTEPVLFSWLKKENVNVVLQAKSAPDDGSLSIYAMHHHIPYINVEVQHGHIDEHLRLIRLGTRALAELYPSLGIKKPAE